MACRTTTKILSAGILLCAALLGFGVGLKGGFIFDDYPNLLLDDDWKVSSGSASEWFRAMAHGVSSPAGRPLALLSFAVNHYFTGLSPFHFKLGNLVLHFANGLLLWTLLARLVAHPVVIASRSGGYLRWAPLLLSIAWLVHPLQVSTVLYVVQRMEIGAATGVLLALISYVNARHLQQIDRRSWAWLFLAVASTFAGLGFKETAAIAPLLAFLIEAVIFRFRNAKGEINRGLVGAFIAGAVIGLFGYLRVALPFVTAPEETLYAIRNFGPWERLLSQGPALVLYIKQILLPTPEGMSFYYDNFPVSRSLLQPPLTLAAFAVLAFLATFALLVRTRWPLTTLGIAWFFACHTLTSNVIPLELVFEHRNYLALAGVLLALAQPLAAVGKHLHAHTRLTLASLAIVGLAALCMIQAATWGDPMHLALTLDNRNPDSPRASYALGRALLERAADNPDSPQFGMARNQFRHSASLPGASPLAAQGLILLDARHNRPIDAATWGLFRESLTRSLLGPEGLSALHAVSNCRIQGNCSFDDGQLLTTFLAVLQRNPESGAVHTLYANFSWNVIRDQALAIRMQREAVRLAPNNFGYRLGLTKFLLASAMERDRIEGAELLRVLERGASATHYRDQLDELRVLRDSKPPRPRVDSGAARRCCGELVLAAGGD